MKRKTKIFAVLLVISLVMASICNYGMAAVQAKSKSFKLGNGMYTVTSEKKKEVRFDKVAQKSVTTLTIPATVKIGNKTYKVTAIKANALKGNKKIKKLVIGKNVKKIGKKAFYGCSNLKKITIKTTKLTTKNVGAKAFAKLNSKVAITVPTNKLSAYQKLLKAKGVTGKNQGIKSSGTSNSTNASTVIPEPEVRFAIGKIKAKRDALWVDTSTDTTFSVGDNVTFTMYAKMPQEMYGSWYTKEKAVTKYEMCSPCRKYFDPDTSDRAVHCGQTGHSAYLVYSNPNKPTMKLWYWDADDTTCRVVYHATLPDGISIYENSVELYTMADKTGIMEQVDSSNYTVSVSGNNISVTINDIKQKPYYKGAAVKPIVMTFRANVTEDAANVNQVNASVTYNYGKGDKCVEMNSVVVRKK